MKTLKDIAAPSQMPHKPRMPRTSAKLLRYMRAGIVPNTRLEAVRASLRLAVSLSARVTQGRER